MTIFTIKGRTAAGIAMVILVTAHTASEALHIAALTLLQPSVLF